MDESVRERLQRIVDVTVPITKPTKLEKVIRGEVVLVLAQLDEMESDHEAMEELRIYSNGVLMNPTSEIPTFFNEWFRRSILGKNGDS